MNIEAYARFMFVIIKILSYLFDQILFHLIPNNKKIQLNREKKILLTEILRFFICNSPLKTFILFKFRECVETIKLFLYQTISVLLIFQNQWQ